MRIITGFHQIVLFCSHTSSSKDWYSQVGFAYKRGYERMHWFALGDGEIMLHPLNHQQPGAVLDAPVARPWGDREFELQYADGQRWAFTESGANAWPGA